MWLKTKNTKTKHLGVHGYLFGHPVNHCICQCLITESTETENSEDRVCREQNYLDVHISVECPDCLSGAAGRYFYSHAVGAGGQIPSLGDNNNDSTFTRTFNPARLKVLNYSGQK